MSDEAMRRRVSRDGTFSYHGKRYVIERPGFIGEWIVVHYDLQSGAAKKVESGRAGESSVHFLEFEELGRAENE